MVPDGRKPAKKPKCLPHICEGEPKPKRRCGPPNKHNMGLGLIASLGRRIRALRLRQKLTLEQASVRSGGAVSVGDWSKYETGAVGPRAGGLFGLALGLGVAIEQLLPPDVKALLRGKIARSRARELLR